MEKFGQGKGHSLHFLRWRVSMFHSPSKQERKKEKCEQFRYWKVKLSLFAENMIQSYLEHPKKNLSLSLSLINKGI